MHNHQGASALAKIILEEELIKSMTGDGLSVESRDTMMVDPSHICDLIIEFSKAGTAILGLVEAASKPSIQSTLKKVYDYYCQVQL